jgi:putative lipoprotein
VSAPVPAVEGVEAGLTFNADGTLSGNSGCNGYSGSYTVEGAQITFTAPIVSTLMLCDETIMAQEEAVYQVLTDTTSYHIEGTQLTLTNNDRVLVFNTTVSYPSYP